MHSKDSTILAELLNSLENTSKSGRAIPAIILTLSLGTLVVMTNYAFSWLQTIPLACLHSFNHENTKHDEGRKLCNLTNNTEISSLQNKNVPAKHKEKPKDEYLNTDLRQALTRKLIEGWVDSLFITNSIIGVNFSVSEAYLYSSIVLYILLLLMQKQLQKECYFCDIIKKEPSLTDEKRPLLAAKMLGYQGFSDSGNLPQLYIVVATLTLLYSFVVTLLADFYFYTYFRDGESGLIQEFLQLFKGGPANNLAAFRLFVPLIFTLFTFRVAYKCYDLEVQKSKFILELKLILSKPIPFRNSDL